MTDFETIATTDSLATLRTKTNGNFDLLKVDHAGASAPTTTWAYQRWADTANGVLKQRDAGDTTWNILGALNARWDTIDAPVDFQSGLSASVNVPIWSPNAAAYALELAIMSDTTTSGSNGSNRWEVQVYNRTTSLNLFATAFRTSTTELTATTTVVATPDQNRNVAANDYLELQITKTGTPTSLASAKLRFVLRGYARGA